MARTRSSSDRAASRAMLAPSPCALDKPQRITRLARDWPEMARDGSRWLEMARDEPVRLLHRQPSHHVARVRRRVVLLQRDHPRLGEIIRDQPRLGRRVVLLQRLLARCAVRLPSESSYAGRRQLLLSVDSAVRGETDVCNRRAERAEKGEAEDA